MKTRKPKPAANWQPTPGTHCRRAIVYMLTSEETHYRLSEIAAALNITKSSVHDALRSAMKAGAVLSVPAPDPGTFRLYAIAPGWTLQHNPEVDTVEIDPWPRQRWIAADGTVRMDRTGATSAANFARL